MNKPTNFRVDESLEVVWDVIHEWEDMDDIDLRVKREPDDWREEVDDVKTAMAWIMDELGYNFDQSGRIVPVQE